MKDAGGYRHVNIPGKYPIIIDGQNPFLTAAYVSIIFISVEYPAIG
ncbi:MULTISPECIES: hypothetical protein [unclassified Methanosarcina]|nr:MULTISPECIES: hypothetical protein [unclassified Methanosarcina]